VVMSKSREIQPDDLPIFRPEHLADPHGNTLKEIEKTHIVHTLDENQWNIAQSAKILGIDRSTLYSKIKRYQISKPA